MKGLCVIILLITITCIVLTIQKKYIIESFISSSDHKKAKLAWDVCLKLPQNMRLFNKKCLDAKKVLDNASNQSNRSQKLSIEFSGGKTISGNLPNRLIDKGGFSSQLLDIESKLGEFIYNGPTIVGMEDYSGGDTWNDKRRIDSEKGLYLSSQRRYAPSDSYTRNILYNNYWLSALVANRSKSKSKKTISIIYDLTPDLFNGQGAGQRWHSWNEVPYLIGKYDGGIAIAKLITLGGFNLKRSQPVNVPGWDSLSNSLQNSYSQTYYNEDPIIGLHHSKVIFTIPESRNITFDEKFFTSLAAPVINAQTFEPKNELPTVYENRPVCIYPKRDWSCKSYNPGCGGLFTEIPPPIGGFTEKLGREPGFKNESGNPMPNGPESNQDAQKTFNIGNHIVYFMVQNTGIIDYVDGGDNDSYKLKFWLLFDNFILAQDFEQFKEVPTFEVELSASEDIPNMEMEFPDDDTVILKVLKKEYVNGSLTDTYVEKIINMGTPIYSDIQESAIERVRFVVTPNKDNIIPETISIKINKNNSGLWEDVDGATEIRHSFLPSIVRSGINQTSIVDEGNGNYSLFMNGELCYRKMEDDSGLTKAFNSEIEEIVFGVEGKYHPNIDYKYSYIEFGMKAITVGIDLYDEMLDANALFQKFLSFLPEDEKSKYCELVYQGQIDGLEEEKVELEEQINQIENDHELEKQKMYNRINEVKVQRDEVQQTAIKAAELQLRELEGNRKKI